MQKTILHWVVVSIICLCAAPRPASAEDRSDKAGEPVGTSHLALAGALPLAYKASAGYLTLKNDKGAATAKVFYIAYERRGLPGGKRRPITFAFNGGPGSSSVWLHLGALGPKKIALKEDGEPLPPPARLVTNSDTWLTFTDLVFIDPVGTGYSRPADEKNDKQFFDMKADTESVAEFIRLYLTRFSRWSSPVYLCGESYGSTRAVAALDYLREKFGIAPSGIILISPVLDFSTIGYQQTNDMALALAMPTYAATAWFHGKNRAAFPAQTDALAQAEKYSLGPYLVALAQGRAVEPSARAAAAEQVARLSGVGKDYVLSNALRIPSYRFRRELLRGSSRVTGRLDSRVTIPDPDVAADAVLGDPSLEQLCGPFASAVNDYLRRDLNVTEDLPYWYLNPDVVASWNWRSGMQSSQGYVDVTQKLADALNVDPNLRVFIAAGIYDLTTPYFAAVYTVNHLQIDASRAGSVVLRTYPAGHMLYTDSSVLRRLTRDVSNFYRAR